MDGLPAPPGSSQVQAKHINRSRSQWTLRVTLKGVKNSSKGSGATPAGSLACPHGNSTLKCSLHSSASARTEPRRLLLRISVRGTLTDMHVENIHTQVEAPNSTPCLVIRTVLDDCGLEHRNKRPANRSRLERRLSSNTEVGSYESEGLERKDAARRLTQAQGSGAFNAPAVFSPNPTVTGSMIGDQHPSCRPFYSFPHQTSQSMAEYRERVETSSHDPPRDARSQRSGP